MGESAILEVFMGEAREIITGLETDIVLLEENTSDSEIINRIFRSFHTLKGSSGIAGLMSVYEFSHKLENLLDYVRSGKISVDNKLIDLILSSIDWIREELFSEQGGDELTLRAQELGGRIAAYNIAESPAKAATEQRAAAAGAPGLPLDGHRYFHVRAEFNADIFESGIDPLMIIEDLLSSSTLMARNVNRKNLPELADMDPEKCYLSWDIVIKTKEPIEKINDVFLFVRATNDIGIEDITDQYSARGLAYLREKKLGEILVEKGLITENELENVIGLQESQKSKIGDILVKKGLASTTDVNEALDEQERIKRRIEVSTVRVDTARLDNLLNLLGEIVIGQSALVRISDMFEDDNESGFQLKNALYSLERTTREFQEQIMSIRMIPIGPTFDQFRRFVRDIARSLNKEIQLQVEGGDTELDKTVIERINDPLKHMIRNAIDHAIESSDERELQGKPRAGQVTLRAYHQEGNVFIEVIDDGRGINLARVREKAESTGLLKEGEEISRERLLSFLFLPGFSTADKVGDLSGRGVGMDVVKTNIDDLRGTVELKTDEGKGTTVRIKMPLTLAIIDGMLVRIGRHVYIIPLLSIIESMKPRQEDIKTVEGRGEVVHFRGDFVPLVKLYSFLGIESQCHNPWEGLVIVVESGTTRVGLLVDDLLSQQQIVIKSLDNHITKSRAISGAAILGDGKVALIIDIHGLVEDFYTQR